MHVCMHTYVHTCMHTYIHTYMHTCIHAHIKVEDFFALLDRGGKYVVQHAVHIHTYAHIRTQIHTHTHTHTQVADFLLFSKEVAYARCDALTRKTRLLIKMVTVCVCMYVHMYAYLSIFVCMHVCMYACMRACVQVHTYMCIQVVDMVGYSMFAKP